MASENINVAWAEAQTGKKAPERLSDNEALVWHFECAALAVSTGYAGIGMAEVYGALRLEIVRRLADAAAPTGGET